MTQHPTTETGTSTPMTTDASTTQHEPPSVPRRTTEGAPAKPSLAIRKMIRDNFESKIPELEKSFSDLLGTPWKVHVDTVGVFTYSDGSPNVNYGAYIYDYFKAALNNLKQFTSQHGSGGVESINALGSTRFITLEPTSNEKISWTGTDFLDGRWRLLFRDKHFGSNNYRCCEDLADVVSAADKAQGGAQSATGSMSLLAKKDIKDRYEAKIGPILARAQKILNNPKLQFKPNFEANYATLAAFDKTLDREERSDRDKLRDDWEKTLGGATFDYFEGLVVHLDLKNFLKDDMMQEAFKDAVTSDTVAFLVKSDISRKRNDCVVEDGVLIIRTNPENWWANPRNAAEDIDQLL